MNDYIKTMRDFIGTETLFTVGCGIIIEKQGRILLQHRTDADVWCIPGGVMELGETFLEAAEREVFEETQLTVTDPQLFGIYSGPRGFAKYANGDKVFSVQIIFHTTHYTGELKQTGSESKAHRFFSRNKLPHSLNHHQAPFILDWAEQVPTPVIR